MYDYGCFVYGSATKSVLHKLEVLQARALQLCCEAFRSSPVPALLVEMGELPLSLRRVKLGLQYLAKLSASGPSFPARRLLQSSWDSGSGAKRRVFFEEVNQWAGELGLEQPNPPPCGNWAAVPFWLMQDRDVNLSFLEVEDKSDIQIEVGAYLRGELETLLVIFTDGSKDPGSGRVGFGVYVAQLDLRMGLRISDGSSVFVSEVLALLWALWWIVKPERVLLCSDSAAALVALREGKSKARPELIQEILMVLFWLGKEGCEVKFCWVPGHAGIEGNEIVDSLAKGSLDREAPDLAVSMRS